LRVPSAVASVGMVAPVAQLDRASAF
jgi:hypothetical protein